MNLCKALKGESTPEVLKCNAEFSRGIAEGRYSQINSIHPTNSKNSKSKLKGNIQTYMKWLSMTDVRF